MTKDEYKAAILHGAPPDGPFSLSLAYRNEVLRELGLEELGLEEPEEPEE